MPTSQVHTKSSPIWSSPAKDVEPGQISHSYGDGKFAALTLKGLPVDKSRTGRKGAIKFIYALNAVTWMVLVSFTLSQVVYTIKYLYQDVATAATIANNFTGTTFLLSVLGGFVADTFLGHYVTIVIGVVIHIIGFAIFELTATYSGLKPPTCTPTLTSLCPPAGGEYTGVYFTGIYTIALGTGLVIASLPPFGAEQFDEGDEDEKEELVHYFSWFFFSQSVGALLAPTLTVYLLTYKSQGWAYGYMLPVLILALVIFLAGTPKYRHKRVGGSFITRMVQVVVAAFLKRSFPVPEDDSRLHDEPVSGGWLKRSKKLGFLDKASILEDNHPANNSKWRLPGVTQVEETKRIFALFPVWAPTCLLSIGFAEMVTFTTTQGATLNRNLGPHVTLPAASLTIVLFIVPIITVPVYDKIILPLFKKLTGNPYGISPLKRVAFGCLCVLLSLVCAALVERKRLTYIRRLGYTQLPYFELPMTMWWLLPQYVFTGMTELFLYVSLYELYFHEVSDATRSIAVSFLFSALALGYFCSSLLVKITDHITKHHHGGPWLKERLNNGGLERHYWVLSIILAVNFIVVIVTSHFYEYNYDLFRSQQDNIDRAPAAALPADETETRTERQVELQ